MKKNVVLLIIGISIISSIAGFFARDYLLKNESKEETLNIDTDDILSFDEYFDLFCYIADNLEIDGFEQKLFTNYGTLVAVEPSATFSGKTYLTIDGSDEYFKSTIETIGYLGIEKTEQIMINIMYAPNFVTNDMLGLSPGIMSERPTPKEISNYTETLQCYKNIIIMTNHSSADSCDVFTSIELHSKLIDIIKSWTEGTASINN